MNWKFTMSIPESILDVKLPKQKLKINPRAMQNFAAALNERNPRYYDDSLPEGILNHPCFPIVTTWPLFELFMPLLQEAGLSTQVMSSLVHFSEHLELHQPIQPKKRLVFSSQILGITKNPAGSELHLHVQAKTLKKNLVFDEYASVLFRKATFNFPESTLDDKPKSPLWKDTLDITGKKSMEFSPLLSFIYDGCTDIVFPIHTSKKFAQQVGLPNIIIQGSATFSKCICFLMNQYGVTDPRQVKNLGANFGAYVIPGENLTLEWKEIRENSSITQCTFRLVNGKGREAIRNGWISFST